MRRSDAKWMAAPPEGEHSTRKFHNACNNRNGRTTSESASRERSCAAVGLSLRSPESSATHASLAYDCLRHMTVRAAKRVEHVKRLRT